MPGPGAAPPPPPASRGTVLLVEEENSLRALVGKYLADQGYAILEARSSEDALQECKRHKDPIHLMISDLMMTEMNGHELARQARVFHPALKTLYLAAHSDSSMMIRGIPLTDISFLPKPFKIKDLIAAVNELLSRK